MKTSEHQRGFTLIEIMLAMAIVAILVSVALPAYKNQQIKARRSGCMASMLGFAQAMERFYSLNYTYLGAADAAADTGAPASTLYPDQCPASGIATYRLTINAATANSFTLRATPLMGSSQDGDGIIEITDTGRRGWDENADGDTADTGENDWVK